MNGDTTSSRSCSSDGTWTTELAAAAVVTTTPAATELLTAALADRLRAVDAYVAPVQVSPEQGVRPGNLREERGEFRAFRGRPRGLLPISVGDRRFCLLSQSAGHQSLAHEFLLAPIQRSSAVSNFHLHSAFAGKPSASDSVVP